MYAEHRDSSPSFDYEPRFSDDGGTRWLSFSHADPTYDATSRQRRFENNLTGCCCGTIFGGGIAAIAFLIADQVNIDYIGDIIVIILFCISCILPIYGCLEIKIFRPQGIQTCIGQLIKATPYFCGSCAGIGSIFALIIVHLSLRFTVYEDIDNEEGKEYEPVVWVVFIGTIILFLQMILFCYCDARRQRNNPNDDDKSILMVDERDYYG